MYIKTFSIFRILYLPLISEVKILSQYQVINHFVFSACPTSEYILALTILCQASFEKSLFLLLSQQFSDYSHDYFSLFLGWRYCVIFFSFVEVLRVCSWAEFVFITHGQTRARIWILLLVPFSCVNF